MSRPRVVIVYGSYGQGFKGWVESLARRLRGDGVEVWVDPLEPLSFVRDGSATTVIREGDLLQRIATQIGKAQKVLVLCSPVYREWVSGEGECERLVTGLSEDRRIAVLVMGEREEAVPDFFLGEEVVDLSRQEVFEEEYARLLLLIAAGRRLEPSGELPFSAEPVATRPPWPWSDTGDPLNGLGDAFDVGARSPAELKELLEAARKTPHPSEPPPAGRSHRRDLSKKRPSKRRPAKGGRAPAAEPPRPDTVHVTTVTPGAVKPGARFLVEVVFHVEGFEVEVGEGRTAKGDVAALPLQEGVALTVRLVALDEEVFSIDDPEARVVWGPPSRRVEFRLRAGKKLPGGVYDLRVEYWCENVQLARSYLEIVVDRGSLAETQMPMVGNSRLPRSAFASYSRVDRASVAQRVDSLKAVGIDVFLDCLDIRQGADWRDVLERELLGREALFLFWSTAARASEWVEKEWRFALERRGLGSIVPNALEPPWSCPPPPELASLQFGSVLTELAGRWAADEFRR